MRWTGASAGAVTRSECERRAAAARRHARGARDRMVTRRSDSLDHDGGKCRREGTKLGVLLVVLLHRRRRVVLQLVHALLQFLHAAPERTGEVGQRLGAEQDQHDHQDQQQLLISQTEHGGTPFLYRRPLTLRARSGVVNAAGAQAAGPGSSRPVVSRSTRRSPTRTVTRWASKYSIKGMAYLRLTPNRSLKSAGPISFFWRSRATSCPWTERRASAW